MRNSNHIPWLLGLLVLFTAMRWPELLPPNFSPVYAICFCAGVYLKGWRAWAVPVALLFISDVVMNYFVYRPMGYSVFSADMIGLYALYLVLIGLGWRLGEKQSSAVLIGGGVLGACAFFFGSNTLVWLSDPVYANTVAGWIQSFTVGKSGFPPAILFLRNSVISGALFTAVIVFAVQYARAVETDKGGASSTLPQD